MQGRWVDITWEFDILLHIHEAITNNIFLLHILFFPFLLFLLFILFLLYCPLFLLLFHLFILLSYPLSSLTLFLLPYSSLSSFLILQYRVTSPLCFFSPCNPSLFTSSPSPSFCPKEKREHTISPLLPHLYFCSMVTVFISTKVYLNLWHFITIVL